MRTRIISLLALSMACSTGADETVLLETPTEPGAPTDFVTDESPPEDEDFERSVNEALADLLGERVHMRLDPDEPAGEVDALYDAIDEAEAAMPQPAEVEKGNTPIVWGWAVKGFNQMQDGNTSGADESGATDHCTLFGRTCDGRVHSQSLDTSYTGNSADFADDLLGRCGRFDNNVDNSWKPCILPDGMRSGGINPPTKAWKWYYDAASCGLEPPQFPLRDLWLAGITLAFQRWSQHGVGAYTFSQTTTASQANITFYCSFGEIPSGKIAIGYPSGDIKLRYAADHVFLETCEDPNFDPNLHAYHFADMYYTYKKGRIGIQWIPWWDFINGCGGSTTSKTERVATIMMHEIGHVMGFAHAQLPLTNSIMGTNRTCSWALNAGQVGAGGFRLQTLQDYDMDTSTALQIYDEDMSCYSPLGGNETPSD